MRFLHRVDGRPLGTVLAPSFRAPAAHRYFGEFRHSSLNFDGNGHTIKSKERIFR
jgi:hypothetical protein